MHSKLLNVQEHEEEESHTSPHSGIYQLLPRMMAGEGPQDLMCHYLLHAQITFLHDLELGELTKGVIVPEGGVKPYILKVSWV